MNMLVDARTRLTIEVVHDLVCPWCYVGVRRLMRAIGRRPAMPVTLSWRPFLLNPDLPRGGMPMGDYVARKFGSEERARRLHASIAELGASEGIRFRFDRIARLPSSVDAHRLVRWTWAVSPELASELVETLFAAHFTEGQDIGDARFLVGVAQDLGLDGSGVRRLLAGADGIDMVHGENLRSHRLGINGVPCFVIGERMAISGAQEPEVLGRILDAAALEHVL